LFGLAIKDHDQAIALDPSAEAYFTRGATYYDRAEFEAVVDGKLMGSDADRKAWFEPATADFKMATEKDPRLSSADLALHEQPELRPGLGPRPQGAEL
jgi:hypothetical protein